MRRYIRALAPQASADRLDAYVGPVASLCGHDETIMDAIETAAVDLASLIVTSRALRRLSSTDTEAPNGLRHCKRMRREIEAATLAYLRLLTRVSEFGFDEAQLAACRCEAEGTMPRALESADALALLLRMQPGALADAVPLRHDLWRLARVITHLRQLLYTAESMMQPKAFRRTWEQSRWLRQRLRAALRCYAITATKSAAPAVAASRSAALAELGADILNEIQDVLREQALPSELVVQFGRSVDRPLQHLRLDWGGTDVA